MYAERMIEGEDDGSSSTPNELESNSGHRVNGKRVLHIIRTGIPLSHEDASTTGSGEDFFEGITKTKSCPDSNEPFGKPERLQNSGRTHDTLLDDRSLSIHFDGEPRHAGSTPQNRRRIYHLKTQRTPRKIPRPLRRRLRISSETN